MKLLVLCITMGLVAVGCSSPAVDSPTSSDSAATEPVFDSIMAQQYGADDYGMHQYVMALLKAGPNRDVSEQEANELQSGHMENIGRMADDGDLILAGPFLDDGELRGIYIFNVKTVEEAEALTKTDPAIKAGTLVMELHPWYGSAGLMSIPELHDRLAKIQF